MNTLIIIGLVLLVAYGIYKVIIFLVSSGFPDTPVFTRNKKPYDPYKVIERFGKIPKAGRMLLLLLTISISAKSQVFVEMAPGVTNGFFSGEIQVGYRHNNLIGKAGFISMPNNTQPVLFNLRGGLFLAERVMVYTGYVRNMMSLDIKSLNKNAFQVGAQYHMFHYDRGTVYIGVTYTTGSYISGHIGMSWNLSQGLFEGCKY